MCNNGKLMEKNCKVGILEKVDNPGCKIQTDVIYEFENVNSGKVMDIENGKLEEDVNVQQKRN